MFLLIAIKIYVIISINNLKDFEVRVDVFEKRIISMIFITCFLLLLVTGCGKTNVDISSNYVVAPMKGEDINELYKAPQRYKNREIEIVGKVLSTMDSSDTFISFKCEDINNEDKSFMLYVMDVNFKAVVGDCVEVIGTVGGITKGKNAFGVKWSVPIINAKKVTIIPNTKKTTGTHLEVDTAIFESSSITVNP